MDKLLVVFGATGQQGGSVVDYVLNHPTLSKTYKIRAITRDSTKPAAEKLKSKGVDVVEADLDKPASLDLAVAGAYAVFAVTNFWEKRDPAVEIAQGKAIADAAVAAGASLLIWSSLPHVGRMTNGELTLPYWDSKADVETYIRGLPIASVFYMAGYYMQNIDHPYLPKPKINNDGTVILQRAWKPDTRIPLIEIADTGKFIGPVLLSDPSKYHGKNLTAATAFYTAQEVVDTLSKVSGKKVLLPSSPIELVGIPDDVKSLLVRGDAVVNKYSYFGPAGPAGLEWTLAQMDEKPTTWEEFLVKNGPWFEEV